MSALSDGWFDDGMGMHGHLDSSRPQGTTPAARVLWSILAVSSLGFRLVVALGFWWLEFQLVRLAPTPQVPHPSFQRVFNAFASLERLGPQAEAQPLPEDYEDRSLRYKLSQSCLNQIRTTRGWRCCAPGNYYAKNGMLMPCKCAPMNWPVAPMIHCCA